MQVLLATDFSRAARPAAEAAADSARRLGARLHLLHVVWFEDEERARMKLAELARVVMPDLEPVIAVAAGSAVKEIVRYATRHAIDLIVVGTHGRTGVSRVLTGSVAEGVVRTAGRPVLTVPAWQPIDTVTSSEPGPIRHCLVCARQSDDSICAACRARIRGEALTHKQDAEKAGHAF